MRSLLLPRHDDPRLARKLAVVRVAFALLALLVVSWLTDAAADGELPGFSASRRTAGSSYVRWDDGPRRFLLHYLAHLAVGVTLVSGLGWLVGRGVAIVHGERPPVRTRYPY